ncbi:MAG: hypothetical protein Q8K59_00255 [Nitrosomonas sp.]|nr:hypothetical protein [Nitrosomonas sp.]
MDRLLNTGFYALMGMILSHNPSGLGKQSQGIPKKKPCTMAGLFLI